MREGVNKQVMAAVNEHDVTFNPLESHKMHSEVAIEDFGMLFGGYSNRHSNGLFIFWQQMAQDEDKTFVVGIKIIGKNWLFIIFITLNRCINKVHRSYVFIWFLSIE